MNSRKLKLNGAIIKNMAEKISLGALVLMVGVSLASIQPVDAKSKKTVKYGK